MTESSLDKHVGITHAQKLLEEGRSHAERLTGSGILVGASDLYNASPRWSKFIVRYILSSLGRKDGVKHAYSRFTAATKLGQLTASGVVVRGSEIHSTTRKSV